MAKGESFKYAFVDLGFEPGAEFCRHLLNAGDFARDTLLRLPTRRGSRSGSKSELAAAVADAIIDDNVDPTPLVVAFCQQQRNWLSFQVISGPAKPTQAFASARDFLTNEKKGVKWFGPWADTEDETKFWAVRTHRAKHYVPDSSDPEHPTKVSIRCHIVAEITAAYVALHWNGFTHLDEQSARLPSQFAYWRVVPRLFEELRASIPFVSDFPVMHTLVLDELLDQYGPDEQYTWEHLKVRAEKQGVVLNARGSRAQVREIDLKGIEALTHTLADSAIAAQGQKVTESQRRKIRNAVLRTLVKEWGTKSYEFALEGKQDHKKLFRGHCYFGLSSDAVDIENEEDDDEDELESKFTNQDSFPHVMCYRDFGGSPRALKFLMEHLA